MIEIEHRRNDDSILIRVSGVLSAQDYDRAVPEIEHAIALSAGPLRAMIRLEDFRGWEIGALWRDLKLLFEHRGDFGRIAVVGESGFEEWGSALAAPFLKAEVRFFPIEREAAAWRWLAER